LSGVGDVWSKTAGKTTSRINLIQATNRALKKLMQTKIKPHHTEKLNIKE
ncbi:hypothetical protein KY362_05570, partial [Candidatus Woesearchaeota archaeon]|nr:hypothetical protein [Candidatus Woesearchaeota archaeon]